jgi:hypothetical protein
MVSYIGHQSLIEKRKRQVTWTSWKLMFLCASKTTVKKVESQSTDLEIILQNIYISNFHPENIKNS